MTDEMTLAAPEWHPGQSWAEPGDWYHVPPELRGWYDRGPITPAEYRAAPDGVESGWRARANVAGVLPPGVGVAESVMALVAPGSLRAYDQDARPREWVRLSFDGASGAAAYVHLSRRHAAREAAAAARQEEEFRARAMTSCAACGVEVPRAGGPLLAGVSPVCAACAAAAPMIAATMAARDELPDGRSRWEAVEGLLSRVWAPPAPVVMQPTGHLVAALPLPPDRVAREPVPVPIPAR